MAVEETGHAVVVGAGVSGLLAAHALAARFEQVTVVERDAVAEGAEGTAQFRAGVPQSRHVHILWSRGMQALEELLPGVGAQLEAAGAAVIDAPAQMRWLSPAGWFAGVPGTRYLSVSREVLESTLRQRILRRPGITLLARHEATGFAAAPGEGAVGGVRLRERGGGGREMTLPSALAVVATGRGSRTAEWLLRLGYAVPEPERIDAHLGYSSRYYRRPAAGGTWRAMYLQGNTEVPRGGVIVPIDGDRWLVTLIGQGEHQPPVEEAAWLDFASSLRSAELSDALDGAEPLSDAVAFRATANEWTHFERAKRWPRGLVVTGDALCRFNPVYGHGMTVAALQAQAIGAQVAGREPAEIAERARETQRAVARCVKAAWMIATGEDCRYASTDGPRPGALGRIQQDYLARVLAAANTDPVASAAFFAVLSLNRRPETLLTPRVAVRATRRRQ
ncbi:FAD-dependent monooxygenase [Actinacidiphila bryophytorum]|uniref:2-polyprenyl-6-methoxyphenol hydroxylase n=1 Tax=Actinacidiphila bryophytorum TaxID=1436133 RepID=A0A9W4H3J6_9ACTN|nr:FAD-dependent monooxygenase [Actinacidiphila bryophytorum]MBM9439809.1 FAD-dependent monooxygenase [Actinacidiphila bryophytorum]MBN6547835.1 FAD-dependent monooxygenase [Actinacidiphila bryophytorum]CAG7648037.1 2-polyprenyl-6-methoxyphenol hydroxylase [Actinacidiphila bryophytorum]